MTCISAAFSAAGDRPVVVTNETLLRACERNVHAAEWT